MTTDPMERLLRDGLNKGGYRYVVDGEGETKALDFYLPDFDIYIEVKRFHSERIGEQMRRAPNVIAAQGEAAVHLLAAMLAYGGIRPHPITSRDMRGERG